MKKLLSFLLVLVVAFSFAACSGNNKTIKPVEKDNSSVTITDSGDSSGSNGSEALQEAETKDTFTVVEFVKDGDDVEYVVELSQLEKETAFYALKYLKDNKNVTFEYNESVSMGAWATKFGSLSQDDSTYTYIYLYTSIESDWDVGGNAIEMTYKDTKLVSSGVGLSSMKVEKDAIIYVGLITYS